MKNIHGVAIFDYKGPDPRIPNIKAFGFMQSDDDGSQFGNYQPCLDTAAQHWVKHLTFVTRGDRNYDEQHTSCWEAQHLVEHLFTWGTDLMLFDPSLPKESITQEAP